MDGPLDLSVLGIADLKASRRAFVRENRPTGLPTKEWAWVYLITRTETGQQYVGITGFSVRRRWTRHCAEARNDNPKRPRSFLRTAIRKYGDDAFICEAIYAGFDWQAVLDAEQALISTLGTKSPSGYNLTDGGEGMRGWKVSEEDRRRLGAQNVGRKASPETRVA